MKKNIKIYKKKTKHGNDDGDDDDDNNNGQPYTLYKKWQRRWDTNKSNHFTNQHTLKRIYQRIHFTWKQKQQQTSREKYRRRKKNILRANQTTEKEKFIKIERR